MPVATFGSGTFGSGTFGVTTAGVSYVGAEQDLVDTWVDSALRGLASLEAIDTGLSQRIYNRFAPKTARFPAIIFQAATPARDVRGVGVLRVMIGTLYIVKAVAQVDDFHALRPVAKIIDAAMTLQNPVTIGDGTILCSVRQEQFSLIEIDSGKQYRHLGGQYQIQAQA